MKKVLSFVLIFGLEIIGLIGTIIFAVNIYSVESDRQAFLTGSGIVIDLSNPSPLEIAILVGIIAIIFVIPMLIWILNLLTAIFGFDTGRFGRIMNTIKMIFHILLGGSMIFEFVMMLVRGYAQVIGIMLYVFIILYSIGGLINAIGFRHH